MSHTSGPRALFGARDFNLTACNAGWDPRIPNPTVPELKRALEHNNICALPVNQNASQVLEGCCNSTVKVLSDGCWVWCNYTGLNHDNMYGPDQTVIIQCVLDGASKAGINLTANASCIGGDVNQTSGGVMPWRPTVGGSASLGVIALVLWMIFVMEYSL